MSKKEAMVIGDMLSGWNINEAEEKIEVSAFLLDVLSKFNPHQRTWSEWNLDKEISPEIQGAINRVANELDAINTDEVITELYVIAKFLIENRTIYSRSKDG